VVVCNAAAGSGRPAAGSMGQPAASVGMLPAVGPAGRVDGLVGLPAAACMGSRHCTAGQSCYVALGRHLVYLFVSNFLLIHKNQCNNKRTTVNRFCHIGTVIAK